MSVNFVTPSDWRREIFFLPLEAKATAMNGSVFGEGYSPYKTEPTKMETFVRSGSAYTLIESKVVASCILQPKTLPQN